jgi:hypothetical protein
VTPYDDERAPGQPADGPRPDPAVEGSGPDLPAESSGPDVPAEIAMLASSVAALDELADLPVADHVARYDALHGELSEALAAIDGI